MKINPLSLTLRDYAQSAPALWRPHLAAAADALEELARLRTEHDEAIADARRYRWLRSRFRAFGASPAGQHCWCATGDIGRLRGPSMGAAIDAAMREGE